MWGRGPLSAPTAPWWLRVKVGAGAYTGSGSVITDDVSPDALALARGRQVEKPGWAADFPRPQTRRTRRPENARGGESMTVDDQKRMAGEAAAQLVESGMIVGMGTGSTAVWFVKALAARGLDIKGVPSAPSPRPTWPAPWASRSSIWTMCAPLISPSTAPAVGPRPLPDQEEGARGRHAAREAGLGSFRPLRGDRRGDQAI